MVQSILELFIAGRTFGRAVTNHLGRLIITLQQMLDDTKVQAIVEQLRSEMAVFQEVHPLLVDMLVFIGRKVPESEVCSTA